MSIKSEIGRISASVAAAYDILEELGAAMPEIRNVDNLADTIGRITLSDSNELVLVDTVTGIPYKLTVVDGKLIMSDCDNTVGVTVYDSLTIPDTEDSNVSYELEVANGKLRMYDQYVISVPTIGASVSNHLLILDDCGSCGGTGGSVDLPASEGIKF